MNNEIATYLKEVSTTADISKFAAVSIALLGKQDVDIAQFTASNAIDNNFIHLAMYGLIGVGVCWSAYEIKNAYQEGGPEAALKQLGIEVVTHATGAVVGIAAEKALFKIGSAVYPTAKAAVNAALEATPGLKFVLGEMADAIAIAGEKFAQSNIGKGISKIEANLINLENKVVQKLGNITSPKPKAVTPEGLKIPVSDTHGETNLFQCSDNKGIKPPISKVETTSSSQAVKNAAVIAEEKVTIQSLSSLDEVRKAILIGENKKPNFDELKILGCYGQRTKTVKEINLRTGEITIFTEHHGGMEKAQEVISIIKKEFESKKLIKQGTEVSKKNLSEMTFYDFADGSRVQIRTEGGSGHPKIDITNISKNIYEKITFK